MPVEETLVTPAQVEEAIARLRARPIIDAAFWHGSTSRGEGHPESDVDIALLLQPGTRLTEQERLALAAELTEIFGRVADVGLLNFRQLGYAKEVARHGQLWFTRNRLRSDRFLAQALSMYADLQVSRREVLAAYVA